MTVSGVLVECMYFYICRHENLMILCSAAQLVEFRVYPDWLWLVNIIDRIHVLEKSSAGTGPHSLTLSMLCPYQDTDLSHYMEKHPGPLDPHNVKLFMFQLLRGLDFCHCRKILHRYTFTLSFYMYMYYLHACTCTCICTCMGASVSEHPLVESTTALFRYIER